MWLEILDGCGNVFTAYSAARDAGVWFAQMNGRIFNNYLESFFVSKGWL